MRVPLYYFLADSAYPVAHFTWSRTKLLGYVFARTCVAFFLWFVIFMFPTAVLNIFALIFGFKDWFFNDFLPYLQVFFVITFVYFQILTAYHFLHQRGLKALVDSIFLFVSALIFCIGIPLFSFLLGDIVFSYQTFRAYLNNPRELLLVLSIAGAVFGSCYLVGGIMVFLRTRFSE